MRDAMKIGANVTIEVRDAKTGKLIKREYRHNLVTLATRNAIRDWLNGAGNTLTISHFAVGTGTTAPTANDTALVTEVFRDVVTKRTPDAGKLTIQYYLPSTAANGYSLAEAGLFNASSGGTMIARVTYQPINKTASLTVTYTWEININAG